MSRKKRRLPIDIRFLHENDLSQIGEIEQLLVHSLSTLDLTRTLIPCKKGYRKTAVVAVAASSSATVVGYMIYELRKNTIRLIRLAVHPTYRGRGVGRQLLDVIVTRVDQSKRYRKITVKVRETELDTQLFLQRCGWFGQTVLRQWYDNDTDAFVLFYPKAPAMVQNG